MTAATAELQGYTPVIMWVDEELVPFEDEDEGSSGDSLDHYTCDGCSQDIALCGADLSGSVEVVLEATPDVCVVCLHLDRCPQCGDELMPVIA